MVWRCAAGRPWPRRSDWRSRSRPERCTSPRTPARSRGGASAACASELDVRVFPSLSVVDPGEVLTSSGGHYRVFTPYWRAWREAGRRPVLQPPRARLPDGVDLGRLPDLGAGDSPARLRGGETEGRSRLSRFLDGPLQAYEERADDLAAGATSRLSPYLHFGCLSPLEVAERAAASEAFVRQLCWRDFFLQFLAAHPTTPREDYRERRAGWRDDPGRPPGLEGRAHGLPDRRRGHAAARRGGLDAEPRSPDRRVVSDEDAKARLARGRSALLRPAGRRRPGQQRRQLAVGRRHGRRSPAEPRSSTRFGRPGASTRTGNTCAGTCPSWRRWTAAPCTSRGGSSVLPATTPSE